jgi:hypothetical protein
MVFYPCGFQYYVFSINGSWPFWRILIKHNFITRSFLSIYSDILTDWTWIGPWVQYSGNFPWGDVGSPMSPKSSKSPLPHTKCLRLRSSNPRAKSVKSSEKLCKKEKILIFLLMCAFGVTIISHPTPLLINPHPLYQECLSSSLRHRLQKFSVGGVGGDEIPLKSIPSHHPIQGGHF